MPDLKMPAHSIRVPDSLWVRFIAKCERVGFRPSEIIRQLITAWVERED